MEDNNELVTVPLIVLERMQAKDESKFNALCKIVLMLIAVIVILIAVVVIQNMRWIKAWTSYDYEEVDEYTVDLQSDEGGNANYIGNNGDIYNGESDGYAQEVEAENTP